MNAKARQRAELILKVRSGQMTATEAAQTLGISRQQEREQLRQLLDQWEREDLPPAKKNPK
jgi:predicted ArsR family transcriptional regulator